MQPGDKFINYNQCLRQAISEQNQSGVLGKRKIEGFLKLPTESLYLEILLGLFVDYERRNSWIEISGLILKSRPSELADSLLET